MNEKLAEAIYNLIEELKENRRQNQLILECIRDNSKHFNSIANSLSDISNDGILVDLEEK